MYTNAHGAPNKLSLGKCTNYAIFKKWNMTAVIMDTLWGGILFSLTRYLTTQITKHPDKYYFFEVQLALNISMP